MAADIAWRLAARLGVFYGGRWLDAPDWMRELPLGALDCMSELPLYRPSNRTRVYLGPRIAARIDLRNWPLDWPHELRSWVGLVLVGQTFRGSRRFRGRRRSWFNIGCLSDGHTLCLFFCFIISVFDHS